MMLRRFTFVGNDDKATRLRQGLVVIPKRPALRRVGYGRRCAIVAVLTSAATSAHADPEVQAIAIAAGVDLVAALIANGPKHDESDYVTLEGGRFDPVKNVKPATAFGGEYRMRQSLVWELRPFLGAGFTSQQSVYGYGGIRIATYWGERIVITPSFAVGGYSRGQGKDLGNPPVLGRFGLDFEYRFDNDVRIGAAYHHFSNGKVLGQSDNPGTEVVGVTLSLPIK